MIYVLLDRSLLKMTGKLVTFYRSYFDSQFPLPKLDLIVLPELSSDDRMVVEHWGLHVYGCE